MPASSEPSGRSLRITPRSRPARRSTAAPIAQHPKHPSRLHRCVACGRPRVYPEWIEPSGRQLSRAQLYCPDCGLRTLDVFSGEQATTLQEIRQESRAQLHRLLETLQQAQIRDWVERFCAALRAGHIVPDDF